MWGLGLYFVESLPVFVWEEALGRYCYAPGSTLHWRTEGWSSATFGRYQIRGIPDIATVPGPKVLLWGDSHVEAKQVADDETMASQLTRIWRERNRRPLTGVTVAEMGRKMADCFFLLPYYERIAAPVCYHFFILHGLDDDITPDGKVFVDHPTFRFVERDLRFTEYLDLKNALVRARLEFLLYPFYRLAQKWEKGEIRFRLGPISPSLPASPSSPPDRAYLRNAWTFVVRQLKERAQAPIAFVYMPGIPTLHHGRILGLEEEEAEAVANRRIREEEALFSEICRKEGVPLIDMTPHFLRRYRESGRFPYGFPNGLPTSGHLNANGHRWVAEAICDFLEHSDALLAD